MKYLIDSSIWIEYLNGSKEGEALNKLIKENNEIFTLSINISEVISKVKRKRGNIEIAYESIIANSNIIEPTPKIAKEAGILHAEMKQKQSSFPLVDALLICTARTLSAKIITTDAHFKSFKDVARLI